MILEKWVSIRFPVLILIIYSLSAMLAARFCLSVKKISAIENMVSENESVNPYFSTTTKLNGRLINISRAQQQY